MVYAFNARRIFKWLKVITVLFIIFAIFLGMVYIFYPVKHLSIVQKYSKKYNIEQSLVCAIINTESGFDKNVVSNKGARGLMQIMENTANWAAKETNIENYSYDNIFNPELNINIGCWYISKLQQQYGGDIELMLSAYNAGSGNVSKWLKNSKYSADGKKLDVIPYKETENYVKKVLRDEKIYAWFLKFFGGTYE